jgi:hypothetical protein
MLAHRIMTSDVTDPAHVFALLIGNHSRILRRETIDLSQIALTLAKNLIRIRTAIPAILNVYPRTSLLNRPGKARLGLFRLG